MIAGPLPGAGAKEEFEKNLYLIRRRIEKKVIEAQIQGFYICSLSCQSIIYKGLFLAEALSVFYPDLMDVRFESRFAIFHQRSEEHTSELQSLMRISYAVFCLKKKKKKTSTFNRTTTITKHL